MTLTLLIVALLLMGTVLFKLGFNKDVAKLWNPLFFATVFLALYTVVVYFTDIEAKRSLCRSRAMIFLLTGLLINYMSILIGYHFFRPITIWRKFNDSIKTQYVFIYGVTILLLSILIYVTLNGLNFNLFGNVERGRFDENASYGHTQAYLGNIISCFPFAVCLLWVKYYKSKEKRFLYYFIAGIIISFLIYTILGFRYRITVLFVVVTCFCYLYPKPKKINYILMIPIIVVLYFCMNIIGDSRTYGHGLRYDVIKEGNYNKVNGEFGSVADFSGKIMERYDNKEKIYFEPIITALAMPLPRALFPEKPKGEYLRNACSEIYGTYKGGNAFLWYTEAYLAFGWFGVIINGLFIGFLCKYFWNNYNKNRDKIGAIILIATFDGLLYFMISRGYTASLFMTFVYYMIVPYLVIMFMNNFIFRTK